MLKNIMISSFDREENNVVKRTKCFSFSHNGFNRFFHRGVKRWDYAVHCKIVHFYAPALIDQGHIVPGLSVCPQKLFHWP